VLECHTSEYEILISEPANGEVISQEHFRKCWITTVSDGEKIYYNENGTQWRLGTRYCWKMDIFSWIIVF